ncbi:MAG: DUF1822 family protein [Rivularia sp. (in: cyanobacteria)]
MTYTLADPKEWLLQITPEAQTQLWQQSQIYATPSSCWRAYINQISNHGFVNWVKAEYEEQATVWETSANVPAFWEFVNGTAILLNGKRVVLIPSEAIIDENELEVPQEWVDIPSWTAEYYIAVQVQPDDGEVRFWGYTTHKELKELASYDSAEKNYCIDARYLTLDMDAFEIAYQHYQQEDTKAAIPNLPELSATEAENLLQQLADLKTVFPRLKVPFTKWGALLKNEAYRLRLHQQRQQGYSLSSSLTNLSAWLQNIYEDSWQAINTFFNLDNRSLAFNLRNSASSSADNKLRAKVIDLGTETQPQRIVIVVGAIPSANQKMSIDIKLLPFNDKYLPSNIKLALLSDSAEILQEVQTRTQDNSVQLPLFEGETGEYFSIRVIGDSNQIVENFMI